MGKCKKHFGHLDIVFSSGYGGLVAVACNDVSDKYTGVTKYREGRLL